MTTVTIREDKDCTSISIVGHAEYAKRNDIVCAAVSALSYTLMQRVQDMDNINAFDRMEMIYDYGNVSIQAQAKEQYQKDFIATLKTIVVGFELLNQKYPSNVRLNLADTWKEEAK